MESQKPSKASLPRRDDLPAVGVSRLRALKLITPDMKRFTVELAGERRTVNLAHTHFPNGGGWSYFVCPSCLRIARTLRMLGDRLVCRRCDGLLARCQMLDKGAAIARLEGLLYGPEPIRNRARLALKLRRLRLAERREKLKGWPPTSP
jgi:hypothetical protein